MRSNTRTAKQLIVHLLVWGQFIGSLGIILLVAYCTIGIFGLGVGVPIEVTHDMVISFVSLFGLFILVSLVTWYFFPAMFDGNE